MIHYYVIIFSSCYFFCLTKVLGFNSILQNISNKIIFFLGLKIFMAKKVFSRLTGYSPTSFCDWQDNICAVFYVAGCNLRCPTCHNKKIAYLNDYEPYDINLAMQNVLDKQKKGWLNHVVITGGEACLDDDILILANEFKRNDLRVKIDTNGKRPDLIKELLNENLVDLFAIDIKAPWSKYNKATGNMFQEKEVKNCFNKIFEMAIDKYDNFLFRTTKVPFLNDKDMDTIKSYLPSKFNLVVQDYRSV